MGRPPLPVGTAGDINTYPVGDAFRAVCNYRDHDGVTRRLERHADTKTRAKDRLREAIRERTRRGRSTEITADTYIRELAELWYAGLSDRSMSPNTIQAYRDRLDNQVIPGVGALRIGEATASRLDHLVKATKKRHGPSTAKLVRTVLSGMFGLAVRHDAIDHNPVRDIDRIDTDTEAARAFTLDEARDVRAKLASDERAIKDDLVDFVDMMLATGLRIGETAAITRPALDLEAGTVGVLGTVVRVTGQGLYIKVTASNKLHRRTLELPTWAVDMLRRRFSRLPPNPWDAVFTAPLGGLRDPRNTQRALRAALDRAGYLWATSHSCRKTVATLMDDAGLTARAAADQLGHAKVSMTQDHYFGCGRITRTGAANVLEAVANAS